MSELIYGLALVALIEGLVLALAPSHSYREMLRTLASLPDETRRTIGLAAMTLGLALMWIIS